jgi:DNA-binding transcriptional regulator/RsmH inhibitor MraZ
MRYGIALSLWSKQEWEDLKAPAQPAQATAKPSPKPRTAPQTKPAVVDSPADDKISEEQMEKFTAACTKAGLNPITVFKEAKVDVRHAKMSDLPAMREAFNKLKKEAADASTTND